MQAAKLKHDNLNKKEDQSEPQDIAMGRNCWQPHLASSYKVRGRSSSLIANLQLIIVKLTDSVYS